MDILIIFQLFMALFWGNEVMPFNFVTFDSKGWALSNFTFFGAHHVFYHISLSK